MGSGHLRQGAPCPGARPAGKAGAEPPSAAPALRAAATERAAAFGDSARLGRTVRFSAALPGSQGPVRLRPLLARVVVAAGDLS